jgi:Phosphodiester glycosidase
MQNKNINHFVYVVFCLICCSCSRNTQIKSPPNIQVDSVHHNCGNQQKKLSISFLKTNNLGKADVQGINHVIIFDPKSDKLDFKVNVGLAHDIYAKDKNNRIRREYIAKTFGEIISDPNSKLNGLSPIAAINADYIDPINHPQGLNVSRGIEYAGDFANKRSSFGISGGSPQQRQATIQTGRRQKSILNYNLVGGNGRFYKGGIFKDICDDLGEFACKQARNRSLVAVTNQGYVILLVNDARAKSQIKTSPENQELLPDKFDDVLTGIATQNCLGKIQEGMLFDGGISPGLHYDGKTYIENSGAIGSVFLIYQKIQ